MYDGGLALEFEDLEDFEDMEAEGFQHFDELDDLEEYDNEYFDDMEGDYLFGWIKKAFKKVGGWVKKGVKWLAKKAVPLFKALAPVAARIVGGVVGGPMGAQIGGTIASAIMREADTEDEAEAEDELYESEEEFTAQGGDWEAYEEMEESAEAAAVAEDELEADQFISSMVWRTARLFRRNRLLRTAIPRVARAALALAKTFRASPRTRWAIRVIPLIVRRTLTRLSRQRNITKRAIVEAMARETSWVLANRRRALAALRSRGLARPRRTFRHRHPYTWRKPSMRRRTWRLRPGRPRRRRYWPRGRTRRSPRFFVPVYAF